MVSGTHIESYFNTVFAVFDKIRESLKHKSYTTRLDMVNLKIPEAKALYSEDNVNSKAQDIKAKKKKKKSFNENTHRGGFPL